MKEKIDTKILTEAIDTLKEAYELYLQNDEEKLKSALRDSCIKRFEYTYETAKKFMNKYLKYAFDKTDLPINDVFREIYGLELIDDYERWIDYRTNRNDTSHEYSIKKAQQIVEILPLFVKDVEDFATKLNKTLEQ
jgi:nucleotidyltransferase substrate binding protein (TIGR01987 family)